VLEIGDNAYTEKYGGARVSKGDVLHVTEGNPQATIVADLTAADHVPSDSFDCIILTQTLQCVYDVKAAVRTLWRILKPGGVLLATFPGITKISHRDWGYTWYWNFTALSARRLLEEVFPSDHVEIRAQGNVLAATALLQGLAAEELRLEELEYRDPDYEVLLTLKAVKPESHGGEAPRIRTAHSRPAPAADGSHHQAVILLYHRVADLPSDPWLLGVTPQHFTEHLEIVQQRAHPISLQQLSESSSGSVLPERSVAITFDDCYADYLHQAKPRLERFGIRATTFIVAGYIECQGEFWWDELDRLLLQPGTLPEILRLDIAGNQYEWHLGAVARYSDSEFEGMRRWRAWEAPPTARHELYRSLWELMHPLTGQERHKVLSLLRTWAGADSAARPSHRLLSAGELRALADGDLIEIGAHTMTHPALDTLPPSAQWDEIQQSKMRLEDLLGRSVSSFAYPFGRRCDYLPETVSIVRDVGFARACSNFSGVVEPSTDRFQLPRVQVQDWDGEEFSRRLERWFEE
jgi:peptidoglycan/xylan/chitin deacetylase (PgdA/CDA1 family)